MKRIVLTVVLLASLFAAKAQPGYVPSEENLEARKEFSEARFGIFIHWGIYSMLGDGEWVMNNRDISYEEYKNLAGGFYPSKFDAEQWVKAFKGAGAKYMTVTSRHHDGFSMFKTEQSGYNVVDGTPFGRDVIGELYEACEKEGIKLHLYYSQLDWGRNDYYPRGNTGHESGRPDSGDWNEYKDFMYAQLTELLTRYPNIGAIWYDGMWDKQPEDRQEWKSMWDLDRQYELIHSLSPSCLVASNHHSAPFEGEDFQIFERDVPGENKSGFSAGQKITSLPLETCDILGASWGYDICKDGDYKPLSEIVGLIARSAGKGANLLLNIGPRPDGSIPEKGLELLEKIGVWMDRYGETIYATQGGCIPEQSWGVTTQKADVLYVHVLNHEDTIFLPLTGNKLVSAGLFDGSGPVKASQYKEGIVLTLPKPAEDTPDMIVELRFKNNL
ncbi:MAG: alpha-L-fucosidase [Bacteroidales bacterium]|nr:alpha-L-fucosidase [Bacteroidales bacterium]